MKTQTIIMPAHWASALINRDYSGLNDADTVELSNFLLLNNLTFKDCLMCSEFEQINTFNGKLCMTLEYFFSV